ncbi:5-carboxymethyl-2-hydroxymuconate Delta-isomerase (plasmid) [Streptomyces cynarae]|uniref:5-carboxymethyl-2-hydroxymuconate Delta-isomerase n=1 Tax=Streptomyces cynarae TaxID=2981134 RepID=A0ABY6EE80_9ACTN|nr:5-carboxymethyl-2-hydroxymuconate Delta-isomerase [Streptomyces cynarae]UXY25021.1 5-carboxymethyl-2-hydroxymuconate Delta-isomerase [Streptomyces cynarae]
MTSEPLVVEFDDPIEARVRLPGLGGEIQGALVAVEVRPSGDCWIRVRAQMWKRWRTQLTVGAPSVEGIGPEMTDIWAPCESVLVESGREPEVAEIVRRAEAAA